MSTREQFEAWYAKKREWYVTREAALEVWQASRAVALEEAYAAAQMCAHGFTFGVDRRIHHNNAIADCCDAIRDLAKENT